MKTEKIMIFENKNGFRDFELSVEAVQSGANDLIKIFHSFQEWMKIETLSDFEVLTNDPIALFDDLLVKHSGIDLKMTGGKQPNPVTVAQLLDIDRTNFVALVRGEKIPEGTCKPCEKLKVKKQGSGVLNIHTYRKYVDYLFFDSGHFTINEDAVAQKRESFKTYIETPEQKKIYYFWVNLCDTLNGLQSQGYVDSVIHFEKLLKNRLQFSYATMKLHVNEAELLNEILNLNAVKYE